MGEEIIVMGNDFEMGGDTPLWTMVKSQFQLLQWIRCLIILKVDSSIISRDSNITDNIIGKVINNVQ